MAYVLRRDDGWFVAPSGSSGSYTNRLQYARVFQTREEAEKERCPENERVMSVEEAMRQR